MIRAYKIKRMQDMKHILSKTLLLIALAGLCHGCVDEQLGMGTDFRVAGFDEGELTECRLNVTVGDYAVSSATRAANPDSEANNKASDQEKAIDNIWVFQYDADADTILIKPRYYHQDSKDSTGHWLVLLNKDKPVKSNIYVVANTNDSTWAKSLDGFNTLAKLKEQNIPNPDVIDSIKTPDFYIPMAGANKEGAITVTERTDIDVPVERMFAKLVISTKMPKATDNSSITLSSILVSEIPATCRVESRSCSDSDSDSDKEKESNYYNGTGAFDVWSIEVSNTADTEAKDDGDATYVKQPDIVLYVPENIQGEVDASAVDKMSGTGIPDRALTVDYTYKIYIENDPDYPDQYVDMTGYTDGSVSVYPGGNKTNNFNVKRNRIYNITAWISTTNYFASSPSANCFIVKPGESLVFWPYYRTETGGGYTIKDYLDPTVEDLTINSVKIIWQDKDVIGDNSSYDKITLFKYDYSKASEDNKKNYTEYEYLKNKDRIRVQTTGTEGNALIGGYNKKGEIIWSWHIWVTGNDPANVGNAEHFTTYYWDSDSIWVNSPRIEGYRIMSCNLGAKTSAPEAGHTNRIATFGPIYQWGRKDPFPSMQLATGYKQSGFCDYNNSNTANTSGSKAGSHINVYDNSNKLITMNGNGGLNTPEGELFQTVKCTSTAQESDSKEQQRKDGLKYSIQHPTTFISATIADFASTDEYKDKANYINDGDWLMGHADDLWGGLEPAVSQKHRKVENKYFYFWTNADKNISDIEPWMWDNYGDKKTIFDPSPKGWRVPPQDFWIGFTKNGESINQKAVDDFESFEELINSTESASDMANDFGIYLYIDGWKTGEKVFFPCPGTRLASGQPLNLMICGNYHCASVAYKYDPSTGKIINNGRVNCFHVHSSLASDGQFQVNPFECQRLYVCKALAGPIRCVLDKK